MDEQKKKKKITRLPPPGKDLASQYPEIAAEWDYELNGDLLPSQVFAHSKKKVWWKCKKCRQRWRAIIKDRVNGHGCPYCAGHHSIPGETDLATIHPNLADEWDFEQNGDLTPSMVTAHSHKKVWWKCKKCGQRWLAPIHVRVSRHGCPYCAGKRPILGKTDLATLRPDLAEEWDCERNGDLAPTMVTAQSNRKVWWKCRKCGQRWQIPIHVRVTGHGCPYCAGQRPIPGKTDLSTLCPDLADEWDYEQNDTLTPTMVTAHSGKKAWWKCKKCGQQWRASINGRTKGQGCPYCAGQRPIIGETDLATLHPDLADEWDFEQNGDLSPAMVTAHSHKKVGWKCRKCGQQWPAKISDRVTGHGCPYCAGQCPILGETDLATLRPDLIEEWDYEQNDTLTPTMVTAHSGKQAWWKCKKCGQQWPAKISDRVAGHGCPYCAGQRPIIGETDLATLHPDLADEWDFEKNGDLTPTMVTAHSGKKVWWRCNICGRSWKTSVNSRSRGSGCRHNIRNRKS